MQVVSVVDNLHEMSTYILREMWKKCLKCRLQTFLTVYYALKLSYWCLYRHVIFIPNV